MTKPKVTINGGSKCWEVDGKFHREDGPAIEGYDGKRVPVYRGLKVKGEEWE